MKGFQILLFFVLSLVSIQVCQSSVNETESETIVVIDSSTNEYFTEKDEILVAIESGKEEILVEIPSNSIENDRNSKKHKTKEEREAERLEREKQREADKLKKQEESLKKQQDRLEQANKKVHDHSKRREEIRRQQEQLRLQEEKIKQHAEQVRLHQQQLELQEQIKKHEELKKQQEFINQQQLIIKLLEAQKLKQSQSSVPSSPVAAAQEDIKLIPELETTLASTKMPNLDTIDLNKLSQADLLELLLRNLTTNVPILQPAPGQESTTSNYPTLGTLGTIGTLGPLPTIPTRSTPSPEHVLNQVDKILGSVATGNIVGIVDNSLRIRAPDPVRNMVTGILKVIFCNPINRLLGRCSPGSEGKISEVQG